MITFNDRATIHVNGEDIRAVHFPNGHTDGDSIIFFTQSNVVHMGDDFFNGMYPFVDIDNGGSVKGMLAAVDKVLATMPDDAKVIPVTVRSPTKPACAHSPRFCAARRKPSPLHSPQGRRSIR